MTHLIPACSWRAFKRSQLVGIRATAESVHSRSSISETRWGIGEPLGFAIDQEFARRLLIVNGDRDNDGICAFGSRPQNFEGANLPVVAALAPVVQEIRVSVSVAGLPKPVGFLVVTLLQRREKARDGSFLRKVTKNDVACPADDDDDDGKQNIESYFSRRFGRCGIKQSHGRLLPGASSISTLPGNPIMLDAGVNCQGGWLEG